jgi:hypothetical protein
MCENKRYGIRPMSSIQLQSLWLATRFGQMKVAGCLFSCERRNETQELVHQI